jgi:uncharacterized membrane protein (UPF0127 family)
MIKKAVFILLLLISIICYLILFKAEINPFRSKKTMKNFTNLQDREQVQIKVGQEIINVEIVNTPSSTTQGLSGREKIGTKGMLFIFPKTEIRYFWMKDMNFDIDIVWIANKKVVEISSDVPKPESNTPDYKLDTYSPNGPVNMVLELNKGVAKELNIKPGDNVELVP